MALLGMQDVSVGFGGFALLEHMNFQIEQGYACWAAMASASQR